VGKKAPLKADLVGASPTASGISIWRMGLPKACTHLPLYQYDKPTNLIKGELGYAVHSNTNSRSKAEAYREAS
jgi:hypothetical protein